MGPVAWTPPRYRPVLLGCPHLAMQLQDVGMAVRVAAQRIGNPGDLPGTGQEYEGVHRAVGTKSPGMGVRGRGGDKVQEAPRHSPGVQPRSRGGEPLHVQRMVHGRAVDDGCRPAGVGVPQQGSEPWCVQRGGHCDDGQVAAEGPDLGEHAHQEVCFQLPFVDFIQDDGGNAVEPRVRQQAAQQDARGDEFDQGLRPGLPFPADRVAHPAGGSAAVQGSKSTGGCPGGHPARLRDDHPARLAVEICEERGDEGGLACSRRRLDDGGARRDASPQSLHQGIEGTPEGEPGPDGNEVEGGAGVAVRRNHPSILP